jgi:chemotaxis protein histidine kinase CheA
MAKQPVRGVRANKPNDSDGVVNNPSLYRGKYRDDVYKDDEEEQVQDPTEEVATQEQEQQEETFVSAKKEETAPEHDYKKRYDDLKRHYDQKIQEFKTEKQELENAMQQSNVNVPLPKTPEELEKFRQEYPDVYDVMETIASEKANQQAQGLQEELKTLRDREKENLVKVAYRELKTLHPDFEEIKTDEKFLQWLEEQPDTISDGVLKNNTNARLAARVIDLYKADMGITTKKQSKKPDVSAAMSVTPPRAKEIKTDQNANKKVWKGSDIAKMKPWEFEKLEADIDLARQEGRIDMNS